MNDRNLISFLFSHQIHIKYKIPTSFNTGIINNIGNNLCGGENNNIGEGGALDALFLYSQGTYHTLFHTEYSIKIGGISNITCVFKQLPIDPLVSRKWRLAMRITEKNSVKMILLEYRHIFFTPTFSKDFQRKPKTYNGNFS